MTPQDDARAERLRDAIRVKRAAGARASAIPRRPAGEPRLLSELQQSLWLAHHLEPDSPAYTLASAFRVRGPLDVGALERALSVVVSRHRLLRSTFEGEGGAVRQVVHDAVNTAVDVIEVDGNAEAAATEAARTPFDLAVGPLVRMVLVEEAAGRDRILIFLLHHILADEASLRLLWRELADAYTGRLGEEGPPVQFDDYVHLSRLEAGGRRDADLDYWRRQLAPLPQVLALPFERPGGGDIGRGRLLRRLLTPMVAPAIRRLAATTGNTPFTVAAFTFQLLVQRYTAGSDVVFATPVSTRHPATAEMIGYFLNPVIVRAPIDEAAQVGRALADFGLRLRESLAHGSMPFPTLLEALSPPRQRDRHPVFQAMLVHRDPPVSPRLGDAQLEPIVLDLESAKFDLTVFVTLGEDASEIALEYRTDRFDERFMQALLDHYETLLEQLSLDPGRATATVSMLSEQEEHRLASYAHGAALGEPEMTLLPQRILEQCRQTPDAVAVRSGNEELTYRELASSAAAAAGELRRAGVRGGDRVGLFIERSAMMIAGVLGAHWAGAAYVPLDPAYPPARTRVVLDDADVAAVLSTPSMRERLPTGPWAIITMNRPAEASDDVEDLAAIRPDSAAYLLYTSGSTGRPKGVIVSHDNLRASTQSRLQFYDVAPTRFLLIPSLAFDSSVAGIFWTLAAGGTLVVPSDDEVRDPRRLAQLAADSGVTALLCVPSLHGQLLVAGGDRLRGLEAVIVAGERCPPTLVAEHRRRLPQARLFNEYGPTEATVWATVHELGREDEAGPVPIGRPIPGVRLEVVDAAGRRVPAGVPGHAWIAGPTVARGYWRRPDQTVERFVPSPSAEQTDRYRTGDLLAWTPEGRLTFHGREDEQIKLRGYRIEPGEIEAVLLEHPAIEEAAVVARGLGAQSVGSSAVEATSLVAFVRIRGPVEEPEWRQRLEGRLPRHLIPSRVVSLPALPVLPNGKVDRRLLQGMRLDPQVGGVEQPQAATVVEQALIALWEGLLHRTGIGPTDNFFELGGHSLLVVEMVLAIERHFEVSLSPAEVFQRPTVRELGQRIEQQRGADMPSYRHLFPIQVSGSGRPFIIAVPHFFSGMFAARFRGERPVYGLRGVSLRAEGNYGRWPTMAALGDELVQEIERRFPRGPCILAGYSFGASMAYEAARVLEAQGLPAALLVLITPMPLNFFRLGPFTLQIDGLCRPVTDLSAADALRLYARHNHPLTWAPYRRARRRLVTEPWRRALCLTGQLRARAGLPLTPRILHADVRVERFRLHAGYRPEPIQTPTLFFNAAGAKTDAAATWRPCFRGPIEVVETPDPHDEESLHAARQVILHHLRRLEDR